MSSPAAALRVLSDEGFRLLLDAGSVLDSVDWRGRDGPLRAATALAASRPDAEPVLRAAALELVSSGRRLAEKLGVDEQLLAVREAVEQASAGRVATWHAQQVEAGARVLEVGCGCGGDSIALAHRAGNLIACDVDPVRAACAHTNLLAFDLPNARAIPEEGLAQLAVVAARADVIYADPDRRPNGRRSLDPSEWAPPLGALHDVARSGRRVLVKAAPALDAEPWGDRFDVTFVSHRRSCVEAFLRSRDPGSAAPRIDAVILPDDGPALPLEGSRGAAPEGAIGAFLSMPDPAAIRAGLLDELCRCFDARLPDGRIALLTTDAPAATPWLTHYRIEDVLPLKVADVRKALRRLGATHLSVHSRGVDLSAPELERQLRKALARGGPAREVDVFATRAQDRAVAIVAMRWALA